MQQLEVDIEQLTISKLQKEYNKAVYCHPASFTSMQSTSCETLGWMKHKLESRLPGKISVTSDMQRISLVAQTVKNLSAMGETHAQSLGREDPLEKGMAIPSSILA